MSYISQEEIPISFLKEFCMTYYLNDVNNGYMDELKDQWACMIWGDLFS